MITVTQRDIASRWAPHALSIPLRWEGHPNVYVGLHGDNDIPELKVGSNHIYDATEWLQDKGPHLIDVWKEELAIYREVMSQVNLLPMTAVIHNESRRLTYQSKVGSLGEVCGMEILVEVEVGYRDCGGPYTSASLYLIVTDDDDDDLSAKTLLSHYPMQLPVDIEAVRAAVGPGIAYLADSIRGLVL